MDAEALEAALTYIRSWLSFRYGQEDIPGFAVAVSHKGKIVLDEAYGYANLRKKTRLTPRHVFRIASQAKPFTATAVMQLQENGKLRIDDRACDYLPWLGDHQDKRFTEVTIRQLLSHGAGITRDGTDAGYWSFERAFPDKAALKAEMRATDLVIDANTAFKYSNYGYALLGLIIEAASGQTYNEYVIQHIITPLGLMDTGPDYDASVRSRLATGYTRREANKKRKTHPVAINTGAMSPALGSYSTASDLCTFYTAMMLGSGKLLNDESKKEMQRSQWHVTFPGGSEMDFGLGLDVITLCERQMIGFAGGFPGFVSRTLADTTEAQLVVATLTNAHDGPAETIAENIHKVIDYFQKNPQPPQHVLSHLVGRYASIFDIIDIIVTGKKITVANPEQWNPLSGHEELAVTDGSPREVIARIIEASPTAALNELVHFYLKRGKVETLRYAGITMYPEATWNKMQ